MGTGGASVQGLREATAALHAAAADLADLDALETVAVTAAQTLRPLVPVQTGALAASVRPSVVDAAAVVTIGAPHAGPVLRGPRPLSPAIARTDAVMDTKAAQILEDGWATIAQRNGLT